MQSSRVMGDVIIWSRDIVTLILFLTVTLAHHRHAKIRKYYIKETLSNFGKKNQLDIT